MWSAQNSYSVQGMTKKKKIYFQEHEKNWFRNNQSWKVTAENHEINQQEANKDFIPPLRVWMSWYYRDLLFYQLANILHIALFVLRAKWKRDSGRSGSASSANTVNVSLGLFRYFIINHVETICLHQFHVKQYRWQTNTLIFRFLNPLSARSLATCDLFPWMASELIPLYLIL